MRQSILSTLPAPAALLSLACSSELERSKAEDLLRKAYPVVVPVTVPEQASAEKGSPEALRMEPTREGARVAYQIRLANPTAQVPLFLVLHPKATLGSTKERHATFERHATVGN